MFLRSFVLMIMVFQCSYADVTIKTFRGAEAAPYSKEIWQLCCEVYKEYPYLYDGTGTAYSYYLESYSHTPDSAVIVAFDGPEAIGVITGIRMSNYTAEHYKKPLLEKGYLLPSIFYVGDLLVLPAYRGQGLEQHLYLKLEAIAKEDPKFTTIAFSEVEDQGHENLRPQNYVSSAPFWQSQGFTRHPEISFTTYYEIVNETEDSPHLMVYWLKSLQK